MTIASTAAVNLGLIIHELLTNAGKYGALSTPGGRLIVCAKRASEGAVLLWTEKTERKLEFRRGSGFGVRLIERLARDLHGVAQMEFLPGGLEATVSFSLAE